MKLLLISNSTNAGEEYLRYPLPAIGDFLQGVREIVFVPYTGCFLFLRCFTSGKCRRVSTSWVSVCGRCTALKILRGSCVKPRRFASAEQHFRVDQKMQEQGLMQVILRKIKAGTPYVGWSAGLNVCCPRRSVHFPNDMPSSSPNRSGRSVP